jgi:hypothetical protein
LIQLGHFRYLQHYNLPQEQTCHKSTADGAAIHGHLQPVNNFFQQFLRGVLIWPCATDVFTERGGIRKWIPLVYRK